MRAKWALMSACPQMMCTCMINRPHTLTPLVPVPSVGAESAAKSEQVGEFQGDAKESETCVPPPMIDLMLWSRMFGMRILAAISFCINMQNTRTSHSIFFKITPTRKRTERDARSRVSAACCARRWSTRVIRRENFFAPRIELFRLHWHRCAGAVLSIRYFITYIHLKKKLTCFAFLQQTIKQNRQNSRSKKKDERARLEVTCTRIYLFLGICVRHQPRIGCWRWRTSISQTHFENLLTCTARSTMVCSWKISKRLIR